MNNKWFLWIECTAIFVLIPGLLWLKIVNTPLILIPIFILCVPAAIWLARQHGTLRTIFWSSDVQAERKYLPKMIKRFLFNSILLFVLLVVWYPEHLFDLPRKAHMMWLLLIVLYPVFSVYPQELLYRAFFFYRYQSLFTNQHHLVLFNAVLFGWMHVVFHNVLAIVYTVIAGLLFADTYRKTGSLRLVCLEHALYGNLIFTLGYGQAFLFEPWFRQLITS